MNGTHENLIQRPKSTKFIIFNAKRKVAFNLKKNL